MSPDEAVEFLEAVGRAAGTKPASLAVCVAAATGDPFRVLVTTLLSLRNRDEATSAASERVLSAFPDCASLAAADVDSVGALVKPSNLWRTKARALSDVSRELIRSHGGQVPRTVDELVRLKWVGRKTANLVATLGHGEEGLCVDTHVHRIANLSGMVRTTSPAETEDALRALLPKRLWVPLNDWLVWFGRTVCLPVGRKCGSCPVRSVCDFAR